MPSNHHILITNHQLINSYFNIVIACKCSYSNITKFYKERSLTFINTLMSNWCHHCIRLTLIPCYIIYYWSSINFTLIEPACKGRIIIISINKFMRLSTVNMEHLTRNINLSLINQLVDRWYIYFFMSLLHIITVKCLWSIISCLLCMCEIRSYGSRFVDTYTYIFKLKYINTMNIVSRPDLKL